jgi:hypothetical protein
MPRGGRRPGAGRKKGAGTTRTRKTNALAAAAAGAGPLPLEVMLLAMRQWHAEGKLALAVSVAKDAAPYLHPRLSAVSMEHSGSVGYALEIVEVLTHAPDAVAQDDGEASPGAAGLPAE